MFQTGKGRAWFNTSTIECDTQNDKVSSERKASYLPLFVSVQLISFYGVKRVLVYFVV